MSVLKFPRLYFSGNISWDPGLANNNPDLFDPEKVELVNPLIPEDQAKSDIIEDLKNKGIWNYYGTHHAIFENVRITGGSLSQNDYRSEGRIINKNIAFKGMLVDIDAKASNGSLLFSDNIMIGDSSVGLSGRQHKPIHARWINFKRNLNTDDKLMIAGSASVVWQTEIKKTNLSFSGSDGSDFLSVFKTSLLDDDVQGIMIRFHTYRTLYFQNGILNSFEHEPRNSDQLKDLYTSGLNFSNPAYSKIVGVIGIWHKDDFESLPGKRVMYGANKLAITHKGEEIEVGLGPSNIELDEFNKLISIDLGATVPEIDANLDKVDIGNLLLKVNNNDQLSEVAEISNQEYHLSSYDERAGIIDIDLSNHPDVLIDKISQGILELVSKDSNTVLLSETTLVAFVNKRDIYLDEDESQIAVCNVYNRGKKVDNRYSVLVCKYNRLLKKEGVVGDYECNSEGKVNFNLTASVPGFSAYLFIPYVGSENKPKAPNELPTISHAYVNVRTLPFDNSFEKSIPDVNLTWSFIYTNIFKVYDVLNPVMSRQGIDVPLNNKERMESLVSTLKRVMSKESFNSIRHMPITRDMSSGKRKLIMRWCELVENGENPDEHDQNIAATFLKDPRTMG